MSDQFTTGVKLVSPYKESLDAAKVSYKEAAQWQQVAAIHDGCDCVDGWLYVTDARGHTRVRQCKGWVRWKKRLIAETAVLPPTPPTSPPQSIFRDFLRPSPSCFGELIPPPRMLPPAAPTVRREAEPGWSKADSGPRRFVPSSKFYEVRNIVRDALGPLEPDVPDVWRRINGMVLRMRNRPAKEFEADIQEAVHQLEVMREAHPDNSFYFDQEKAALWCVGRATRCSRWMD